MNSETEARTRETIQAAVNEFLHTSGFNEPLNVAEKPYYPYHAAIGESYPDPGSPGCYVWTDGNGKILDVGKASRTLGTRIWCHLGRVRRPGEECDEFPNAERFVHDCKPHVMVWTIPVQNEKKWWVCLSLEGFLTEKLLPDHPRRV